MVTQKISFRCFYWFPPIRADEDDAYSKVLKAIKNRTNNRMLLAQNYCGCTYNVLFNVSSSDAIYQQSDRLNRFIIQ